MSTGKCQRVRDVVDREKMLDSLTADWFEKVIAIELITQNSCLYRKILQGNGMRRFMDAEDKLL